MASYAPTSRAAPEVAGVRPQALRAAPRTPHTQTAPSGPSPSLGRPLLSTRQEPRRTKVLRAQSAPHGPVHNHRGGRRAASTQAVSMAHDHPVSEEKAKAETSDQAQNNGAPTASASPDGGKENEYQDKIEELKAQLQKANKAELRAISVRFKLMAEAQRMYRLVQGMQTAYNDSVDTVERAPMLSLSKPQMEFMLRKVAGLRESMGKAEVAAAHAMEAVAEGAEAEVVRIHRRQDIEEKLQATLAAEAAAAKAAAAAASSSSKGGEKRYISDWIITMLSLASVGVILALQNAAWLAGFIWGTAGFCLGFLS